MALAQQHTFQVLTKRPDRMREWLNDSATSRAVEAEMRRIRPGARLPAWPLWNVWIGTSVEDQKRANQRIPILMDTKAAVRFLSVEPLLGPVSLKLAAEFSVLRRLHWMIVGGESGHRARPMHPDWARSLRDECRQLKIAFFFKQFGTWGSPVPDKNRKTIGLMPDGREVPVGTTGAATLARLGKKLAGERLDGSLHRVFPTLARPMASQGSLPFGNSAKKAA
jgi:protein gp37